MRAERTPQFRQLGLAWRLGKPIGVGNFRKLSLERCGGVYDQRASRFSKNREVSAIVAGVVESALAETLDQLLRLRC